MYAFGYDERKSQSNLKKHGIDFVEAQALWDDPYLVEIPARTTDEVRFLVIGKIQEKHWSAVVTALAMTTSESSPFVVPEQKR